MFGDVSAKFDWTVSVGRFNDDTEQCLGGLPRPRLTGIPFGSNCTVLGATMSRFVAFSLPRRRFRRRLITRLLFPPMASLTAFRLTSLSTPWTDCLSANLLCFIAQPSPAEIVVGKRMLVTVSSGTTLLVTDDDAHCRCWLIPVDDCAMTSFSDLR
jgi:hypothetical protein